MVYARRRNTKTYAKKRYIPRPSRIIATRDYVPVEAGFVKITVDQQNVAFDIYSEMLLLSQDWITLAQTFSEFKIISVDITNVPFNVNTTTASDIANGLMGIREGIYEATPVTMAANLLARYHDVIPFVNIRSAKLSKIARSGEWFNANAIQTSDSDVPKLTCYISYSQAASTNTNRAFLMVKFKMLARGRLNI